MRARQLRNGLLALDLGLALALLGMWITPQGQLRRVHWEAPALLTLDVASIIAALPEREVPEQGKFLETLERPLFSPSRRPPPPPPPPPPPASEEAAPALSNIHLYGLYGSGSSGGAILRVDGKNERVATNQTIKGWKLTAIGDTNVILRRGSRQQVLELVHVIPGAGNPPGAAQTPAAATTRTNARTTGRGRPAPAAATSVPEVAPAPPPAAAVPAQGSAPATSGQQAAPASKPSASPPQYRGLQSAR